MSNQTSRGSSVGEMYINGPVRKKRSVKPLLFTWIILLGGGLYGAYYYLNHLKAEIEQSIAAQTEAQIIELDKKYAAHISSVNEQILELESSINKLNELLSFVKDSTSDKTDNSNMLYTQLGELKVQLDNLKKELEVLK